MAGSPTTTVSGMPASPTIANDGPTHAVDACPLCGAYLDPGQEWCMRCGAAARTRLAASPNLRAAITVLAILVALSLGVIAAAVVTLAGDSRPAATVTRTVTRPVAATTTPATTAQAPTSAVSPAAAAAAAAAATAAAKHRSAGRLGSTPAGVSRPIVPSLRRPLGGPGLPRRGGLSPALEQRLREAGLLPRK